MKLLPHGLNGSGSTFAWQLADCLSVEKVEKAGIKVPERLYKDLVAFRHLRQDARVAAVRGALDGRPQKAKLKKPAPAPEPKKESTIIAVCGYLSQTFTSMSDASEWLRYRLSKKTYPRGFIVEGKVTVIEKNFKKAIIR